MKVLGGTLLFVGGLIAGSILGMKIVVTLTNKSLNELTDTITKEVMKRVSKNVPAEKGENTEGEDISKKSEDSEEHIVNEQTNSKDSGLYLEPDEFDYANVIKELNSGDGKSDGSGDLNFGANDGDVEEPFLIAEEEFEGNTVYDKEHLLLSYDENLNKIIVKESTEFGFRGDEDSIESETESILDAVGIKNLKNLLNNSEEIIYVRSPMYEIDYAIELSDDF